MKTKIIPSLILLATSLSYTGLTGCQNTQEMKVPPVEPPKRIDVTYVCERGLGEIGMRFFPDHGVAVLVLDGQTHELQQQISASGTWYSNAKYSFRSKGGKAWLEIGRMMPIHCEVKE